MKRGKSSIPVACFGLISPSIAETFFAITAKTVEVGAKCLLKDPPKSDLLNRFSLVSGLYEHPFLRYREFLSFSKIRVSQNKLCTPHLLREIFGLH
eukprot:sb/3479200/